MPTAHVRVVDAAETPALVSVTPNPAAVVPGGMVTLTVTLDIPAPSGGSTVTLAVAPSGAGSVPANVVVAADQLEATFDYTDGNTLTAGHGDGDPGRLDEVHGP